MREIIRTVIVPLAAAAIGAVGVGVASYYASKSVLIYQERIEKSVDSYADYLSKVSELSVLEIEFLKPDHADKAEIYSRISRLVQGITAAKSRVAMFGRSEVIVALNDFRKAGSTLSTTEECEAFMGVVTAMRTHVSGDAPDGDLVKNLKGVVYGTEEC